MEELQAVMEAINGLGSEAKSAFVLWVIMDTVKSLATTAVCGGIAWCVLRRIAQAILVGVRGK